MPVDLGTASTAWIGDIPPYQPEKNEKYMSPKMCDHFRQILHTMKRSLMEKVDNTVDYMQEQANNFPDLSDRATQEEEFSFELRTRDRERKLIKKIEAALKRLEEGSYGYCESCGEEIGLRRLEARPTAILCIDCKTLSEMRERQGGE
ncbi:MAG: RNA polymerase-binding protein DksA [Gammaproteobacteria bacterium]|nr:RNA polymerase-binding protein DksA [Gammaproteobacteria bacterium]